MNAYMNFRFAFLLLFAVVNGKEKPVPIVLSDGNWTQLLEGEWLVKFYAPWCPACKALKPTWESVAGWAEDLSVHIAEIDVNDNPGLSGRFLVTALPTIYHVQEGEFRQYAGSKSERDFVSLIDDKKWQSLEPVAWYRHPASLHMGFIGFVFKASFVIRDIHETITTVYGIPTWGSYTLFAIATIACGVFLGLLLVIVCDFVLTPRHRPPPRPTQSRFTPAGNNMNNDIDKDSDVVVDDTKMSDVDDSSVKAETSTRRGHGDSQARHRVTTKSTN